MLQIIMGRAGTGKTALLLARLEERLQKGESAFLLVPEQASFVNEERLVNRLGLERAMLCDVLSFTRLAGLVFRQRGGLAGVHLESAGKIALMSVTLEQLVDKLTVFRRSVSQSAFVGQMCSLVQELVSAGATGEELRGLGERAHDPNEKRKLYELSLILDGYRALLERGYNDPEDSLFRAYERLSQPGFFTGRHVFVDGFVSFSNGEWKLLERALSQAQEVTVTLCCDEFAEHVRPSVFSVAQATARRLVSLARKCGAEVRKPLVLTEQKRFRTAGLAHFAQNYSELRPLAGENSDGVVLHICKDIFAEVELTARQIASLVRQGYRYGEIAVAARRLEDYQTAIHTVFPRYDIPVFMGARGEVSAFPLVRGLLAAVQSVESGFDTEKLMLLAKSGLVSLTEVQAADLENYAYLWKIKGKTWKTPFTSHPEGLRSRADTPRQAALAEKKLARLNASRETLLFPLVTLEKRLKNANGRVFATSLYGYLQDVNARENLLAFGGDMDATAEKAYLDFGAQVWDEVMKVLDVFGGPLGESVCDLNRFSGLLELCLEQLEVSLSPQTQDQVLAGSADTMRPNGVKVLFALGLTQDGFPAAIGSGSGILTEAQRDRLTRDGYPLLITALQKSLMEQFYAYFVFTQPSERLFMSYPRQSLRGETYSPSSAVEQTLAIFGEQFCVSDSAEPPLMGVTGEKSGFDMLCRTWREDTALSMALRDYFHAKQPEKYQMLEQSSQKIPFRLDTPEGRALFDSDLRLSPSRLEQYYGCPFSYYCKYGLQLYPRQAAEFNPMESGRLLHAVLEQMLRRHGGKGLSNLPKTELEQQTEEILREELATSVGDVNALSDRERFLFARQKDTAVAVLERLGAELEQSRFLPVAVELPVGQGGCAGWVLPLSDGSCARMNGVVDRVDVFEQGGVRYLRVVDYKTGVKQFRTEEVLGGLNMQMLIYLFTLQDNYTHALDNLPNNGVDSESIRNLPAGVLYMPSRLTSVPAERQETDADLQEKHFAGMRMNGLLLNHMDSLRAMEEDLGGRFIPVKLTKDGSISKTGTAPVSEKGMAFLRRSVEDNITGMGNRLKAGEIPALPVGKTSGGDLPVVCGYCDYASLCRRETDEPVRLLPDNPDLD